jgi:hypothetical protein
LSVNAVFTGGGGDACLPAAAGAVISSRKQVTLLVRSLLVARVGNVCGGDDAVVVDGGVVAYG